MPLLGQVSASITGLPSRPSRRTAPDSSRSKRTMLPWHCQQPLTASALLSGRPATRSARMLSRLARISPARAWWLTENCSYSRTWQVAQSFGVTRAETQTPSCSQASTSSGPAVWHSKQPTPNSAWRDSSHSITRAGLSRR